MPNKCVRCGKIYDNKSMAVLNGCGCGSRVFLFLRDDQAAEMALQPPSDAKPELGWLEDELSFLARDKIVSIELDAAENLRVLEQGSYELDIASLMKGDPLVVKSDKQVYYIKMPSVLKK